MIVYIQNNMAMSHDPKTVGQVFAERLLELRKRRGLTQEALAHRLASEFEYPMHRATLAKIEAGSTRGENVTVKDVFAIAAALNVAPVYLITPADDEAQLLVTPNTEAPGGRVRDWTIGSSVLQPDLDDEAEYFTTRPPAEMKQLLRAARGAPESRARRAQSAPAAQRVRAEPAASDDAAPAPTADSREEPRPRRPVKRPRAQGAFAWRDDA